MSYIRGYYKVPAKRGARVQLGAGFSSGYAGRMGTVTSAMGHRLRIRLDGDRTPKIFHPAWEITYL